MVAFFRAYPILPQAAALLESDYELTHVLPSELASSLPSIEAIEAELSRELDEERSQRSAGDEP
jgi:hypothetical protein